MATFHDITKEEQLNQLNLEVQLCQLATSCLTHEVVTPLRCIIVMSELIKKDNKNKKSVRQEADIMVSTAELVLAQVKLLLDKKMLDNYMF